MPLRTEVSACATIRAAKHKKESEVARAKEANAEAHAEVQFIAKEFLAFFNENGVFGEDGSSQVGSQSWQSPTAD